MITKEIVEKVAARFLGEKDMWIRRTSGGFASICGFQVTVFLEDDSIQTFFHDDNTEESLVSKMIQFSEIVENMELTAS
jgi:hypothetical protein